MKSSTKAGGCFHLLLSCSKSEYFFWIRITKSWLRFCKWPPPSPRHVFGLDNPCFEGQLHGFVVGLVWFHWKLQCHRWNILQEFMCFQSNTHKPWKNTSPVSENHLPPITTLKSSILLQRFSFTLPAMITASRVKHMSAAKRVGESITEANWVRYAAYHNFFLRVRWCSF